MASPASGRQVKRTLSVNYNKQNTRLSYPSDSDSLAAPASGRTSLEMQQQQAAVAPPSPAESPLSKNQKTRLKEEEKEKLRQQAALDAAAEDEAAARMQASFRGHQVRSSHEDERRKQWLRYYVQPAVANFDEALALCISEAETQEVEELLRQQRAAAPSGRAARLLPAGAPRSDAPLPRDDDDDERDEADAAALHHSMISIPDFSTSVTGNVLTTCTKALVFGFPIGVLGGVLYHTGYFDHIELAALGAR